MRKIKDFIVIFPLFIIFLFFSILIAISLGSVHINFDTILSIILHKIGLPIPVTWFEWQEDIIFLLRFPRILMTVVVGAMLSVSGVAAQGIFKNPIAEPYIIGISAAASFGAAISIVLGLTFMFSVPIISFFFSITAVIIVYQISRTRYQISVMILLLTGIAISFFFSSLTSFILYFSDDKVHNILHYTMGGFSSTSYEELLIVYIVMVPGVLILFLFSRDLNIMVFGDDVALSMGVNIERSKKIILILMTLLASTTVAFCGIIGFVGLIIPQIMRLLVGNDNRKLIPLSAVGGAILMVWADLLSRTLLPPLEIPVGIFTSLMGGPFFIYLIIKKKNQVNYFNRK